MKKAKNPKKINKGKLKNLLKRKNLLRIRGSATAETILIIAVVLVIVITIFYPQMQKIINSTFESITLWYKSTLNNLGMI